MIRILFFLVVIFFLGLGFAWLADRPGDLTIAFEGYRYQVTLMVAAVAGVAVVSAIMIAWWVLKSLWNSPRMVNRYFRARRRDRGHQSLSTGLIAAGAGDNGLARKMGRQASDLLSSDQEPLIHLLEAQTLLLEGKHGEARARFEQMLDDPETQLLGLRGLYLEAQRLGERDAARHYAEKAAESAPQLIWASNAAIETLTAEGDWEGALKLVGGQSSTGQITKEEANRRTAVLLTAKSMAEIDTDAAASRAAAVEANRLLPDFVPAAAAAGRVLYRLSEFRKGTRLLESVWKKSPHPEIAEIYVRARPGDSTHDRLKRARRLQSLRKNHVESYMTVARAANDAGEFRQAREAIEAALKLEPRESAFLLLADIEQNDTGDQGRVRHWLSKAVRAPRDPAWTADGYVSETWAPMSPITGSIGAFEWKVPVERLGSVIEADETAVTKDVAIIPEEPVVDADCGKPDREFAGAAEDAPEDAESPAERDGKIEAADALPAPGAADKNELEAAQAAGRKESGKSSVPTEEAEIEPDGADETGGEEPKTIARPDGAEQDEPVPLHRIPDDPGVDEETETDPPGRFRLF